MIDSFRWIDWQLPNRWTFSGRNQQLRAISPGLALAVSFVAAAFCSLDRAALMATTLVVTLGRAALMATALVLTLGRATLMAATRMATALMAAAVVRTTTDV